MVRNNLRPFIKWPGGKRALLPQLLKRFPEKISGTYFEPFLGAGSVALAVTYPKKILSDTNSELINAFLTVRDRPEELIEMLKKIEHSKETYYSIRNWDREENFSDLDSVSRAARLIYLNKTGFNGLYRVNRLNRFNVPYGGDRLFKVDSELIQDLSQEFQKNSKRAYRFKVSDFENALTKAKQGDFVYLDPPYVPISKTAGFVDYSANGFDLTEQRRLASFIERLTEKRVRVVLSNSNTKITKEIYGHLGEIFEVSVNRQVAAKSSSRTKAREVIVDNLREIN